MVSRGVWVCYLVLVMVFLLLGLDIYNQESRICFTLQFFIIMYYDI